MHERLQPSLLDRLTDNAPQVVGELQEKRDLSAQRLREAVCRDLTWLFNTTSFSAIEALEGFPDATRSVLNYGLAALAGKTASTVDAERAERMLKEAIWQFEPRLIRRTVRVALLGDPLQSRHNQLHFKIEAELWADPVPLRLLLHTELDLETGQVSVAEAAGDGTR